MPELRSKTKVKDIEINKKTANEAIRLSSKILRIIYIVAVVLAVYVLTLLFNQWGVLAFLRNILKILSPLFIGIVIAWLLGPAVKGLTSRGMNRILATILVFFGFIGLLALIVSAVVPMLWNQVNEFIGVVPEMIERINNWVDSIFARFNSSEIYDFNSMKEQLIDVVQNLGTTVTNNLPDFIVNSVKAMVSGLGLFVIGLLISFYMLFDFESASKGMLNLLPTNWKKEAKKLLGDVNTSLRSFVHGMLIISTVIFVGTSIAFWAIGLEAPLVFGLICGITNFIPYVGPYIGGAPAAIVGFAQSPTTGVLAIVVMVILQFVEGNVLQPIIMGKTMKLHPVVIIIGLLVFGSLFGVLGLILATPIIAVGKIIIVYLDEKFDIMKWIDLKR